MTLKLEGKQQNQWKLLDLKIFVQPDDELNQGIYLLILYFNFYFYFFFFYLSFYQNYTFNDFINIDLLTYYYYYCCCCYDVMILFNI